MRSLATDSKLRFDSFSQTKIYLTKKKIIKRATIRRRHNVCQQLNWLNNWIDRHRNSLWKKSRYFRNSSIHLFFYYQMVNISHFCWHTEKKNNFFKIVNIWQLYNTELSELICYSGIKQENRYISTETKKEHLKNRTLKLENEKKKQCVCACLRTGRYRYKSNLVVNLHFCVFIIYNYIHIFGVLWKCASHNREERKSKFQFIHK